MRSEVAPDTVGVRLEDAGVTVRYTDGAEVFYRGVPEPEEGSVTTPPGKDVHVLVTDPDETEGVMTYVNDRSTHDDVLESTGVGRIFVEDGERRELFPGVTVIGEGHLVRVEADPETARGRVFVFAEDPMGEESYEVV